MKRAITVPPEIASTRTGGSIDPRFTDEGAMLSSAYLVGLRSGMRFVEVVNSPWKGPSFGKLADTDPRQLLELLGNGVLASTDLTFAAETAGRVQDADAAVNALLPLLAHPSPLVREGAVYGLSHHLSRQWVRMRVEYLAAHDLSPGVRAAAVEALDDDGSIDSDIAKRTTSG